MKKVYFLLLLLVTVAHGQVSPVTAPALQVCDDNDDGFYIFNLLQRNLQILGALDPTHYNVKYFVTSGDLANNTNSIAHPESYQNITSPQMLYVRVTNNLDVNDFGTTTLFIAVYPQPRSIAMPDLVVYQSPFTGSANFDFNAQRKTIVGSQQNVFAFFYTSEFNATNNIDPLENCYTNIVSPQTIWVRIFVNFAGGCFTVEFFTVSVLPDPNPNQVLQFPDSNLKARLLQSDVNVGIAKNVCGQNIKIDVNNDGEIQADEARIVRQLNVSDSDINDITGIDGFRDLNILNCSGNHLTDFDAGNMPLLADLNCADNQLTHLDLSATKVNYLQCYNNNLYNINLKNGIYHLLPAEIPGNWQNNPGLYAVCTDEVEIGTINSLLQLNGYTNVIVTSNCLLATSTVSPDSFEFYPNPTIAVVNVKSAEIIRTITVYDTSGRTVLSLPASGNEIAVDISACSAGMYYLKIKTAKGEKTQKVIKR